MQGTIKKHKQRVKRHTTRLKAIKNSHVNKNKKREYFMLAWCIVYTARHFLDNSCIYESAF